MADQPGRDEKTEEATPRRMDEAREKGQVAFSAELMAATTLVSAALAFVFVGMGLATSAGALVESGVLGAGDLARQELDLTTFAETIKAQADQIVPTFLLFLAPMVLLTWLVGYAQVGLKLAPKAVSLDASKLHPQKGLQRMFSMRSVMRTGLATLKICLVMAAVLAAAWVQMARITPLTGNDLRPSLAEMGWITGRSALAGIAVVIALAVTDLVFQRFQHKRDLRMTKKEVKDELKNTEGDPQVKARIRRVQREMANRRMMNDVPEATVVITNPTHFAVALKYEEGTGRAPVVVAKGVDSVAFRIREVAQEAGVVVHEDPPLARALHRMVEIGDEIPEELFQAVASVLAYVFKVQGRKPAAAPA